jgi:hypothetical protein
MSTQTLLISLPQYITTVVPLVDEPVQPPMITMLADAVENIPMARSRKRNECFITVCIIQSEKKKEQLAKRISAEVNK